MADLTCDHGSIRACMMRVAVLAADGSTPSGDGKMYVTDTLVELTLEPEVQEGDSLEARNACGDYCIDFKDDDRIRWWNATMKICTPNAELSAMMAAGFTALTDGGDTIGGKFPPLGRVTPNNGVSIELWSIRLADDGQTRDGDLGYYQWGLPRTRGWRPATQAFSNAVKENEFVGRVFMNDNWGDGPANDWDQDTTDTPIVYVATNTLPEAACGVQAIPAQT
jgi:hypothetical protein